MQLLALFHARAGAMPTDFMPLREIEERALWPLWQSGMVRQMWFRQDSPQPVFLLEAADATTAQLALAELPMVQAQLFSVELIALRNFDAMQVLFATTTA
jgi:hypothetical protein